MDRGGKQAGEVDRGGKQAGEVDRGGGQGRWAGEVDRGGGQGRWTGEVGRGGKQAGEVGNVYLLGGGHSDIAVAARAGGVGAEKLHRRKQLCVHDAPPGIRGRGGRVLKGKGYPG